MIDCLGVSEKEGCRLEIEPRPCSKPEESSPSGTSGTDSPGAGVEEAIFPNNQQPNLGKMTSMVVAMVVVTHSKLSELELSFFCYFGVKLAKSCH